MMHMSKEKSTNTVTVSITVLLLSSKSHFIYKLKLDDVVEAEESSAYVSAPVAGSIYVTALSSYVGIRRLLLIEY